MYQIKHHNFILIYVPKTVLNPPVNGKIQRLFKALGVFQVLFKANLVFKDFSRQSCYPSHFQACANPQYDYFSIDPYEVTFSACCLVYHLLKCFRSLFDR